MIKVQGPSTWAARLMGMNSFTPLWAQSLRPTKKVQIGKQPGYPNPKRMEWVAIGPLLSHPDTTSEIVVAPSWQPKNNDKALDTFVADI